MRVCIGGTFNRFHKGHRLLVDTAIKYASKDGFLFIGISCGKLVETKSFIEPYNIRKKSVLCYIIERCTEIPTIVLEPIETIEGPTLTEDFDLIVVSEETEKVAIRINEKRTQKGLRSMDILTIPLVLSDDKEKISSTRIINKEIDKEGHLL
jgi:pantetheine-phosphate adenylyltransferase